METNETNEQKSSETAATKAKSRRPDWKTPKPYLALALVTVLGSVSAYLIHGSLGGGAESAMKAPAVPGGAPEAHIDPAAADPAAHSE